MLIKKTPKISAHKQIAHWINQATPSLEDAYVFHNPSIKLRSKIVIANRVASHYRHKIKTQVISQEESSALNLIYAAGYEPLLVWLIPVINA